MYRIIPYTGADLPAKCLCLTYDDGPGKDTCEIARFLSSQGIRATFFMVGKYAVEHQDILKEISALGHLIGNHTYEHPDLPFYLSVNGDVHGQIMRTDSVIRKYISGNTIYFRSPYGKWSKEVANELNLSLLATVNHIGPIHWDVGGVDCYYWKLGKTIEETVFKYLDDINEIGRGIVLLHDEIADMNFLKEKNCTLQLTKRLIPLLKNQGYTFVRLDEISTIKEDAVEHFTFRLKCSNGKFVSLSESSVGTINVEGTEDSMLSKLSIEELSDGKVGLKASNGLFLSLHENNNTIEATGNAINDTETFDLIPLSAYQVALRAYNGNYLCMESKHGGKLLATAVYMRGCERFTFLPTKVVKIKKTTFRQQYKSVKRQFLYIKSKIQQASSIN